jgi:hypothetical protein
VSLREYVEAMLVAVLFAFFVKAFLFEAYQIPSGSMEQNLLVGDHVVVDKLAWAPRTLPWGRSCRAGRVAAATSSSSAGPRSLFATSSRGRSPSAGRRSRSVPSASGWAASR